MVEKVRIYYLHAIYEEHSPNFHRIFMYIVKQYLIIAFEL